MPDRLPDLLDRKISEIDDHLLRLRSIREHMHEDPALVTELTELMVSPDANGRMAVPGEKTDSPHLPKILDFFRKKSPEEGVSAKEIEEGTGVQSGYLYSIFDQKHKDQFEVHKPSPRRKFWRLKRDGA